MIMEKSNNAKDTKKKSCLINKTVEIAVIPKSPTSVLPNGEDVALLQGCAAEIIADVDSTGNIKGDILTPEEAAELEVILGLGENGLNPNNPYEKNFWQTNRNAKIELRRTTSKLASATVTLDLSKPYDFIKYKIALSNRFVAKSWGTRNDNPDYKYAIRNVEDEALELRAKNNIHKEVISYLTSIEKSKTKLFDLIRLFNTQSKRGMTKLTPNQSAEWLFDQLWSFADNIKDRKILHDIITMPEELREGKVFILNAITSGALILRGTTYQVSGGEIIAYSEQEAVDYLFNPANQDTKLKVSGIVDKYLNKNK